MSADRNLLFGVLALQMDFVSRDALIRAMNGWVLEKTRPLGALLHEQGALAAEHHALLEALVQAHLKAHADDPQRSLAAVSSVGSVRRDLEAIADADLQASLAHVSAAGKDDDPYATRATTAGTPTSSGLRYSILRPHRKGGLGEVFVARDEELRREVALKEIQDKHADHPESRARFLLEAEVTGGLEHPGIVPVYGLGHYGDGRPFYAMRFIRGDNFQDAIARYHKEKATLPAGERALRLRQLLGRFVDVCEAIAYAHSRGVLHRDLKPGNVMLGKYGETLVVDWGLAKPLGRTDADSAEGPLQPSLSGDSSMTQAGRALGTPAYMSPEQAAGRLDQLGPASDIYGLGATLYHLLTGRAPFIDRDPAEVLGKVERGEYPHPREVDSRTHPALEAVCRKAMALRPEDRYPSAQALAQDIERWLADEPVSAWREPLRVRVGRWTRRHHSAVTAMTALAILLLMQCALPLYLLVMGLGFQPEAKVQKDRLSSRTPQRPAATHRVGKDGEDAEYHNGLGAHLFQQGKLNEAEEEFRTAIRLDPNDALPHANLGSALYGQGKLQQAEQEYQQAVGLGFQQAAEMLHKCDRLITLAPRLPAALRGDDPPADAQEMLGFAELCSLPFESHPVAAARFYSEAFAADPKRADDLKARYRYNAARYAALAGCGQGKNADELDDKEKARMRRQALDWLRADLAAWAKQAQGHQPAGRAAVQQTLRHWKEDADLAGVRGEALAKLPEAERGPWKKLWADVGALLAAGGAPETKR